MLDALLAEEKIPSEHAGQTQVKQPWSLFCIFYTDTRLLYTSSIDGSLRDACLFDNLKHIQVILCNDCEKRGDSPFHWLYHKCPHCGSFNTRVV